MRKLLMISVIGILIVSSFGTIAANIEKTNNVEKEIITADSSELAKVNELIGGLASVIPRKRPHHRSSNFPDVPPAYRVGAWAHAVDRDRLHPVPLHLRH